MGIPVLCLGASGSGKSSSLRGFSVDEVGIFNVAGKPLPFKKKLNKVDNATYEVITKVLSKATLKKYVIDDSQFLLVFELFDKAKISGYGKFVDMAVNFRNLIDFVVKQTPPDCIVYFLHHSQETEQGIKAKTVGRMIDDHLTLEALFSVVLRAKYEDGKYVFATQTNGQDSVKTPMQMFDALNIDNDLKFVDESIRNYWDLDKTEKAKEGK